MFCVYNIYIHTKYEYTKLYDRDSPSPALAKWAALPRAGHPVRPVRGPDEAMAVKKQRESTGSDGESWANENGVQVGEGVEAWEGVGRARNERGNLREMRGVVKKYRGNRKYNCFDFEFGADVKHQRNGEPWLARICCPTGCRRHACHAADSN